MTLSSDVPKKRFKIQYGDLLIDGIHVEGVLWRLRLAVKVAEQNRDETKRSQRNLVKPDDELIGSLARLGIEARRVQDDLLLEAVTELKHGPAGLACLLDNYLFLGDQEFARQPATKRLCLA